MCGICGMINRYHIVNHDIFEKSIDVIKHRGPDDRGSYYCGRLALGHRRLAIIDLSKEGHQPFSYMDRYILVFNGEIYNYIELREELSQKGYAFRTNTDTEVLVAMYACYREKCVSMLNGMWSFAIYDKIENTLFCSRDRFGVKPFYYYNNEKVFAFGSEIKQLLEIDAFQPHANRQRVVDFIIAGRVDYSNETMFAEIKQLCGGHNLLYSLDTNDFIISKYYDLSAIRKNELSYDDACIEFRRLFEESIKLRLRADVPIGYCLSGGLDSSSIVCMADHIIKGRQDSLQQHSISSCFEDKRFDEQEYIDEVVRNTDVTEHKIFPQGDKLFERMDQMIWHMDEPFATTTIYAQWNVFEAAKENGLKVMLDGQGADEQLAGYTGFYSVLFADYLKRFEFKKCKREINQYQQLKAQTEGHISSRSIILNAFISTFVPLWIIQLVKKVNRYSFLDLPFSYNDLLSVYGKERIYPIRDNRQYTLDSIEKGMAVLLHCEDRDSMAHSIESRVPYLDYKLVEFIFSLPLNYKIRNGITKSVMRDGLKTILPDKIRKRYSKLGFTTPEAQWIKENVDEFGKELEESCIILNSIMDTSKIMEWYKRNALSMKRGNSIVWRMICVAHWIKVFNINIMERNSLSMR